MQSITGSNAGTRENQDEIDQGVRSRRSGGADDDGMRRRLDVECDVLFLGDALSDGLGSPLVIHGNFTYTNCGSCLIVEENGPARIEILKLGHEMADVIGEWLVHLTCTELINCSYSISGVEGTAKGPLLSSQANGEISFQEQEWTRLSGGSCPFYCPTTLKVDIVTLWLSATYITN